MSGIRENDGVIKNLKILLHALLVSLSIETGHEIHHFREH